MSQRQRLDDKRVPNVTVRLACRDDQIGIQALFRKVFGRDFSAATYRWKFNSLTCQGSVAENEGVIVGFYGVMPWQIEIGPFRTHVLQVCDVAISPDWRGTQGLELFRLLAGTACSAAMDPHSSSMFGSPHTLFGFPSPSNARLGRRTQHYLLREDLHDVHILPRRSLISVKQVVQHNDRDALIQLCARALASRGTPPYGFVMGCKTPDALLHRYVDREHEYEFWSGRSLWLGQPHCLAVTRNHGNHTELMDIIAPHSNIEPFASALARACSSRGHRLTGWMTQSLCFSFTHHEIGPKVATISVSKNWPGLLKEDSLRYLFFGGDVEFR